MKYQRKSPLLATQLFSQLNESNRVFSNIIALELERQPERFPLILTGTATCPGCQKMYDYRTDQIYRNISSSCRITCSTPGCGDVFFVHAVYRPSREENPDKAPLYIYAELYTTLKGQMLFEIQLDVKDIKEPD
jgi:hypothetical protein